MSSVIYDVGQAHLNNAENIRHFIFTDKSQKNIKYRTIEEYHEFLKGLMENSYENYRDIAKDHGWI